jgi:hypothetical protein
VTVFTGFGPGSGSGHGGKLKQQLRPGEQVRLEWSSNAQGNQPSTSDDVVVVASVQEVTTDGVRLPTVAELAYASADVVHRRPSLRRAYFLSRRLNLTATLADDAEARGGPRRNPGLLYARCGP